MHENKDDVKRALCANKYTLSAMLRGSKGKPRSRPAKHPASFHWLYVHVLFVRIGSPTVTRHHPSPAITYIFIHASRKNVYARSHTHSYRILSRMYIVNRFLKAHVGRDACCIASICAKKRQIGTAGGTSEPRESEGHIQVNWMEMPQCWRARPLAIWLLNNDCFMVKWNMQEYIKNNWIVHCPWTL